MKRLKLKSLIKMLLRSGEILSMVFSDNKRADRDFRFCMEAGRQVSWLPGKGVFNEPQIFPVMVMIAQMQNRAIRNVASFDVKDQQGLRNGNAVG